MIFMNYNWLIISIVIAQTNQLKKAKLKEPNRTILERLFACSAATAWLFFSSLM